MRLEQRSSWKFVVSKGNMKTSDAEAKPEEEAEVGEALNL
jgi:hypothetical protein